MKKLTAVLLAVCLWAVLLTGCAMTSTVTEVPLSESVTVEIREESGQVWLNNSHISCVSLMPDGDTGGFIYFHLNTAGSNAFLRATQANLGKTLSLCVNGETVWEPTVEEVIRDTAFMISSDDYEECIDLFERLTK